MQLSHNKADILIIDNEKKLCQSIQLLLEKENYKVIFAETGEEGIKQGTLSEFDVVLIEMKLPDLDGLIVLKEIKSVHPNSICFIITSEPSYDSAIESTRLGAFGYIPKPFSPDELLRRIEQGIEHRLLIIEAGRLKKEREENLLEVASEKSRLNTIIKSISDGVLVINRSEEFVYYNYAALKILDLYELKIGDSASIILPDKILNLINKIFNSEKILLKTFTTQIELKPNSELVIEAACTPIPDPDGSIAGVVVVLSNITTFKKIELIKSQFISMVAHELKTPIAAVQGYLDLLLNDEIEISKEQEKDYLTRSVTRLKSLIDLVNDLLDISKMELKTKQREIENIKLDEVIFSAVKLLEIELKKKNIVVETYIHSGIPVIKADLNEINRLIMNLLSNAIKYNNENGKIFIHGFELHNYAIIKIQDTGIGMSAEEKSKLFNEFYRAKNDKTRLITGTGLGLTIVKRIVDSYHGKIEVDSETGTGTTFTISLPISNN
jgi:signal transduction histidine kinase